MNLTLKTGFVLKFLQIRGGIRTKFVAKVDDDAYVQVPALATKLQIQSQGQAENSILCHVVDSGLMKRATRHEKDAKFVVPRWMHEASRYFSTIIN